MWEPLLALGSAVAYGLVDFAAACCRSGCISPPLRWLGSWARPDRGGRDRHGRRRRRLSPRRCEQT